MGVFSTPIEVGDSEGTRFEWFDALVDTGATYTMLPSSVLEDLGVTLDGAGHSGSRTEASGTTTWQRLRYDSME